MKLSTQTRYAIRILFELARYSQPLSTAVIAENAGISVRAVENIHAVLRQYGITSGTMGAKGGISLEKPLDEISLGLMVRLFDDGVGFEICHGDKSNDCPNQHRCETREAWNRISCEVQESLDAVSLGKVLGRHPATLEKCGG